MFWYCSTRSWPVVSRRWLICSNEVSAKAGDSGVAVPTFGVFANISHPSEHVGCLEGAGSAHSSTKTEHRPPGGLWRNDYEWLV